MPNGFNDHCNQYSTAASAHTTRHAEAATNTAGLQPAPRSIRASACPAEAAEGSEGRPPSIVVSPDLPTVAESGVEGFRYYGWNGVIAPRGTPRPVILKFNRVMNAALDSAELRKQYFALGEEPAMGTPEDFGKLIRADYESMGKLVKLAGIKPE